MCVYTERFKLIFGECQSASESGKARSGPGGHPAGMGPGHAGVERGWRLPARRPGFGSPLCPAGEIKHPTETILIFTIPAATRIVTCKSVAYSIYTEAVS